ncbi:MAG TPA: glycosyltransferase [Usitatibacter sp.]|nr:glycosyltransferase [Usitatibacter sp.]
MISEPREPSCVSMIVRTMGRETLARALDCAAAQTHRPLEIVLVDAGDRGIAPAEHRGVPVRVVREGRLDRPRAANAGLAAARGEWILFLDEDDEIAPGHVAELLAAARAAGARAAYSQTRLVDAAGRAQRDFGGPFNRALLLNSNYLAIHAVLFHRSFVEAGCRFDESLPMFEDWDFWLQLTRRDDFAFTGRPTAVYRAASGQSGAGAGPNLDRERALAVREALMRKWRT